MMISEIMNNLRWHTDNRSVLELYQIAACIYFSAMIVCKQGFKLRLQFHCNP